MRYQALGDVFSVRLNDFEQHITTRVDVLETNMAGKFEAQTTRIDGLESTMNARFQELQHAWSAETTAKSRWWNGPLPDEGKVYFFLSARAFRASCMATASGKHFKL